MNASDLSAVTFREALSQMRSGAPVTAADLIGVADEAHESAIRADAEAAICREVEADARGLALSERLLDYGLPTGSLSLVHSEGDAA
jgi:hypothetical protein